MKKYRMRFVMYFLILIGIGAFLGASCFSYWKKTFENYKLKVELQKEYDELVDNESDLENNLDMLQDEEYVAKYAREKYLYTKDGEIIIDYTDDSEESTN